MSEQRPRTPDEARQANQESGGAPRYFTYPAPLPSTDKERKRFAEAAANLPPCNKKRRSRRRK